MWIVFTKFPHGCHQKHHGFIIHVCRVLVLSSMCQAKIYVMFCIDLYMFFFFFFKISESGNQGIHPKLLFSWPKTYDFFVS